MDARGEVQFSRIPSLAKWQRGFTLRTVLTELRKYGAGNVSVRLPRLWLLRVR